jgi:hypothetical protein
VESPGVSPSVEYLEVAGHDAILEEQFDYFRQHHTGLCAPQKGIPCQECDRWRKIQELLMIKFR